MLMFWGCNFKWKRVKVGLTWGIKFVVGRFYADILFFYLDKWDDMSLICFMLTKNEKNARKNYIVWLFTFSCLIETFEKKFLAPENWAKWQVQLVIALECFP